MNNKQKFISVVIPIYNEETNLPSLLERLVKILESYEKYEIILVDDGSSDESINIITGVCTANENIKLVQLSRNFGHQTAITAGLTYATGDAVLVMDGDLQDPPEVIPMFVDKWQEGYDVVYAIRKKRKENILKRMAYFIFYRTLKFVSNLKIPLDSGDFSIMDRKIVNKLNSLPEKNRFVRGLRSWLGYKQIGLEYERAARLSGTPKFTLIKLIGLAYDGLTSFSHLPLKLATFVGISLTGVSALGILYIICLKLFIKDAIIEGWTSNTILMIFIGGIQLLILGIMGEYLARIFDEVKNRPQFLVASEINTGKDTSEN